MRKEEHVFAAVIVVIIILGLYFIQKTSEERLFQNVLDSECQALVEGDVEKLLSHTTLEKESQEYNVKLKDKTDLLKTVKVKSCSQNIRSLSITDDQALIEVTLHMNLVGVDGEHPTSVEKTTKFVKTREGWKIEPHQGF
ncbi:hypothetical protein ACFLRC_04745 [Candidatus Altiarchaeota archaeon]